MRLASPVIALLLGGCWSLDEAGLERLRAMLDADAGAPPSVAGPATSSEGDVHAQSTGTPDPTLPPPTLPPPTLPPTTLPPPTPPTLPPPTEQTVIAGTGAAGAPPTQLPPTEQADAGAPDTGADDAGLDDANALPVSCDDEDDCCASCD